MNLNNVDRVVDIYTQTQSIREYLQRCDIAADNVGDRIDAKTGPYMSLESPQWARIVVPVDAMMQVLACVKQQYLRDIDALETELRQL